MSSYNTGTQHTTRTHLKTKLLEHLQTLSLEAALLPNSQNQQLNDLVKALELLNPTPQPLHPDSFALLLGRWQLVYASRGTVVTRRLASVPQNLLENISIKQVWQDLKIGDKGNLIAENGAEIELFWLGIWQLTAAGIWNKQENLSAADVSFYEFSVQSKNLFGHADWKLPTVKIPVLEFLRNEALWITSYLDSEIRVGRGATGNLFVFRRQG